jgi:hypothetical protein
MSQELTIAMDHARRDPLWERLTTKEQAAAIYRELRVLDAERTAKTRTADLPAAAVTGAGHPTVNQD